MPTIWSTCADRSAIRSASFTPCARIASLNCAPIDLTGLSAFIALCMTTDRSFQRTAASCLSVRPTMFCPLKTTLPPVIRAGGASSWAMPNSRVDLPQPDSPTMPMNSPGLSARLTRSTATTLPASMTYSTDRSLTSSTAGPLLAGPLLAGPLGTDPPHRPQCGIPDLVEGVVEQGEGRAEGGDAGTGNHCPQVLPGLQGLVVLGPVEHGPPDVRVGVAQADELQAGGEQ